MLMIYSNTKNIKQHLDTKLSRRMKIYFFLSIIMTLIMVYEVIITWYDPLYAILFFGGSILIGFVVSRMFKVFWNPDEQLVTSRIDTLGWIILWCYIVFAFARHYLLGEFIKNSFVIVVTFAIIAGVMIGRFVGMRRTVYKTLKKQGLV